MSNKKEFEQDPRYQYEVWEKNVFLTYEEQNDISKIIRDPDSSWIKIIINTIRVIALFVIGLTRQNMRAEELRENRQIYLQRRRKEARDKLDDSLDGKKNSGN